jgi:hypothetical protein
MSTLNPIPIIPHQAPHHAERGEEAQGQGAAPIV